MSNITFLIVELLAAAAFAVMWFQDRKRGYLLWWAVGHALLPALALSSSLLRISGAQTLISSALIYTSISTVLIISMLGGVFNYRGIRIPPGKMTALAGAIFIILTTPALLHDIPSMRITATVLVTTTFITLAMLLWPMGVIARVTSICFSIRAIASVGFMAMTHGVANATYTLAMMSFSSCMAVATALLLLLAAFQRSEAELKNQNALLALSHEIASALQGVSDEKEMGSRIISIILKNQGWHLGVLMLADTGAKHLNVISVVGDRDEAEIFARFPKLALDGSLSGRAFCTQKTCYSHDAHHDDRIAREIRADMLTIEPSTRIVIPLLNQGKALGVLFFKNNIIRDLSPSELQTLESLGKMVGTSVANCRNVNTLTHRATHDSLTGLGNRSALHEWFLLRQADQPCSLMLFDLNHFKEVNDALGHSVGDQLLQMLAARLYENLASKNIELFRLGGDEFVVIYNDAIGSEKNIARAQVLADWIAEPIYIADLCLRTSAAIGIAEAPLHSSNSHELLRCADLAMYQAKQNSLTAAYYDQSRDSNTRDRMQLLSGVTDGLERGEFELYYQPFIDLADNRCSGCEGLLRWQHPQRGLLNAGIFMPMIEATDLIQAVTYKVIDMAISDIAGWQQQDIDFKVSINLSARNLLDADLCSYLLRTTHKRGVAPKKLQLEITETILMKDPVAASVIMLQLREAGFTIALDDFGTGYSSLAYLARFPIHGLKIDQSFVRNMMSEPQSRSIVASTIALAHQLDLQVTAEGVEYIEEAELLRDYRCDSVQGYLHARPMPKQDFENWWRTQIAAAPSSVI